ncbi:hypothetical protein HY449_01965 [Candidatus Pacearchaeota archaeon]|nr:hypothetical protein [Candidatus Pacearchaeota archaeon]
MEVINSNDQDFNEVFIVDKDIINYFFKDENYETAELFFVYLTTSCNHKKAYMIPSVFEDISKKINEKLKTQEERRTEIISYLNNWIEKADLLGEDKGDEKHDTLLLYRFLNFLHSDKKVIIISNKSFDEDIRVLPIDKIWVYLLGNKKFKEYIKLHYGVDDGASY